MNANQHLASNLVVAYQLGRGLPLEARVAIRMTVIEETELQLGADFSKYKTALKVATFSETQKDFVEVENLVEEFLGFLRITPGAYDRIGNRLFIHPSKIHRDGQKRRNILHYLADHDLIEISSSRGCKPRLTKTVRRYGTRMLVLKAEALELRMGGVENGKTYGDSNL